MVREQGDWVFYVLIAMLLCGMALTVVFGTASSNHSYVTKATSSQRR